TAPLAEAEPALRPVHELAWERDGLHLRLTGQGPWELDELVALADSVASVSRAMKQPTVAAETARSPWGTTSHSIQTRRVK
ncbi:MAG: hypothetical protein QOD83_355, partial [Solirubrobacteraceae bacterium]|nr:hypothetical protein [Solirubrobacteraceae bacterium]